MSRKRNRSAQVTPDEVPEAVPEDILAEGSGPVQAICHVGIDAIGTDVPETKGKKAKGKRGKAADADAAASDAASDAASASDAGSDAASDAASASDAGSDAVTSSVAAAASDAATASTTDTAARRNTKRLGASRSKRVAQTDVADADAIADADATADDANAEVLALASDVEAADDATAGADPDTDADADTDGPALAADVDAEGDKVDTEDAAGDLAAASDEATAVLPTSAAELPPEQLKQLIEALVFASDKPMTLARLRQLTRISDIKKLEITLADLAADYADRGLVLQQVSGGYQFRTRTEWSAWVQQLIAGRPVRLTRAQLETLAIIAYRQPITRPEIDDIRGVDSSATLKLLIDRQLIRILGKKEEVGRPMLYGTTKEFLDFFSLGDLRELPTLREYSELTDESRQVISDRLGPADDEGGEGGEGQGSPDGTPTGDASGGEPGLEAAPATAADLIAAYVAELDAAAERSAAPTEAVDVTASAIADGADGVDGVNAADGADGAAAAAAADAADGADGVDATAAAAAGDAAAVVMAGTAAEDVAFDESATDDAAPIELASVDSGSLADIDPFATIAEGSGPIEVQEPALDGMQSGVPDPSVLAADMAESAESPADQADPPQE